MGVSPLSDKSIRRIARTTGLDVVYAYGRGTKWHAFVTADHRHGVWHRREHTWCWIIPGIDRQPRCSSSCRTRFSQGPVVWDPPAGTPDVVYHTCDCGACPESRNAG
jgi:hypothetical protein